MNFLSFFALKKHLQKVSVLSLEKVGTLKPFDLKLLAVVMPLNQLLFMANQRPAAEAWDYSDRGNLF